MHWIDFDPYCKVFTNSSTKEYTVFTLGLNMAHILKDLVVISNNCQTCFTGLHFFNVNREQCLTDIFNVLIFLS